MGIKANSFMSSKVVRLRELGCRQEVCLPWDAIGPAGTGVVWNFSPVQDLQLRWKGRYDTFGHRLGQSKTQINAHLVRVLSGSFGTDRCLPCTVSHLPSSVRRLSLGPTAVAFVLVPRCATLVRVGGALAVTGDFRTNQDLRQSSTI